MPQQSVQRIEKEKEDTNMFLLVYHKFKIILKVIFFSSSNECHPEALLCELKSLTLQ